MEMPEISYCDTLATNFFYKLQFKENDSLGICLYDSPITRECAKSADLEESYAVVFGYPIDPFDIIYTCDQMEDACISFGWTVNQNCVVPMMQKMTLTQ